MTPPSAAREMSAGPWLRVAAVAAGVLAALDPSIPARTGRVARVLLHDASASCGARAAPTAEERARWLDELGAGDRVALVAFGADAVVASPPGPPGATMTTARAPRPDPHGSSLAAAFDLAARILATSGADRREAIVATDALATDEVPRVHAAAAALRASGCTSLRWIARTPRATGDVVHELRGPGWVRAGESFVVEAHGVADDDGAEVVLLDGAGVVETRGIPRAGAFRIAFARLVERAGTVTYSASARSAPDVPPAVARVAVAAPGTMLVVGDGARELGDVRWPMPATRCDVRDLGVDAAARFAAHDIVLFDDIAEPLWTNAVLGAVTSYARGGGGVVLGGGAHSFGPGGWGGRPVERISPLLSRPPDEPGAFLYVAIDASGSMAEPWAADGTGATRDAAVRVAAAAMVHGAPPGTTIAVRRFAHDVLAHAAATGVLDDEGRGRVLASLAAPLVPRGATALLPVLVDAQRSAAPRTERRRHALVFTDGRTAEPAADLHAGLVALEQAGVDVHFVVPGTAHLGGPGTEALREAVAGTRAAVHGAATPDRLSEVFRAVEIASRSDEAVVGPRALRATPGPHAVRVPDEVRRADRTWAAAGSDVLAATDRGEPVVAIRAEGLGAVAAVATRVGDPAWLAGGPATDELVAGLLARVARRASSRVRVEREQPDRLLVRADGDVAPVAVVAREGLGPAATLPLRPAGQGLLAATGPALLAANWVDVVAADGRVRATVGLDTPAPREFRDPPPVDTAALSALAAHESPPGRMRSRAAFCVLAILLVLGAAAAERVKSRRGGAR